MAEEKKPKKEEAAKKAPAKKPAAKPAAKSTAAKKPAAKSTASKASEKPAAKKPAAKPAAKSTAAKKPAAKTTATKPAAKTTAAKPAAKTTAAKPAAKSAAAKPAAKSAASKPAAKTAESKPATKTSAAKPAAKSTAAKPATKTTAAKPAAKSASSEPKQEKANVLKLHHLRPAPGAKTAKTRVGRGEASKGKTAGRGTKGTKARYQMRLGFEGGGVNFVMRTPKLRGFKSPFKVDYQVVNVEKLADLYPEGGKVTVDDLVAKGAVRKGEPVKVLGNGDISVKLDVTVEKVSRSAKEKIEAAGGSING
jgi:large subunit ribosomal protein L15